MTRQEFLALLKEKVLVFDGAMGTMLQSMSDSPLCCPDIYNLEYPELVEEVHRQYVNAGCHIVQINTFGANRVKLAAHGLAGMTEDINIRGVQIARKATQGKVLVAGNIGPMGQLLEPFGGVTCDEAYDCFYEQASLLVSAGVDLVKIETMTDLHEAKIAVRAARDAGALPIICSLTYEAGLRTLTGTDPETAAVVLESAGVDVLGTNCGFGPEAMTQILRLQCTLTQIPLLVQPNAGLPRFAAGRTHYDLTPEEYARHAVPSVEAGAAIVGGCCGTTPDHIRLVVRAVAGRNPVPRSGPAASSLASLGKTVWIAENRPTVIVGERINPTARKKLASALLEGDFGAVVSDAREQIHAGARVIDVNVGLGVSEEKEAAMMAQAVTQIQAVTDIPISIDTRSPYVMERALMVCRGKPLLNSASGERGIMEQVIPLAARFGAAIVGLAIDERGIPETAEERLQVARRIVSYAIGAGLSRKDVYVDTLTLTAGAQQHLVPETLRALAMVKKELGARTVLGVSNVSHGLPQREHINSTFTAMALVSGLDMLIANPHQDNVMDAVRSADVILGRDLAARAFIARATAQDRQPPEKGPAVEVLPQQAVKEAILNGLKDSVAPPLKHLLAAGWAPLEIVNQCIVPPLETVGEAYERQELFLPQLLLAAEAAQEAFRLLEPVLKTESSPAAGTVIIATVKGDVHDIGKNIVGLLLKNHGFKVVDLGRDVECATILEAAIAHRANIIGLSALMTTTMAEMGVVASALQQAGLNIPLLVGGAVVTEEYAGEIGAHYAADAAAAVRVAKRLLPERGEAL
jgi:5-methyltetrahydrofolate--homocysteine methyltransferase